MRFLLRGGQCFDGNAAVPLLKPLPPPKKLLADKAYDCAAFRDWLSRRGTTPVIPNKINHRKRSIYRCYAPIPEVRGPPKPAFSVITGRRRRLRDDDPSQGSEFPAVVIPITTQHYMMLQRNLLYTGVTRGKRLVILFGQKKAVAIAVKNVSGRRRWSKLREWLNPAGFSIPRLIGA